jgi:hypothetical protein
MVKTAVGSPGGLQSYSGELLPWTFEKAMDQDIVILKNSFRPLSAYSNYQRYIAVNFFHNLSA